MVIFSSGGEGKGGKAMSSGGAAGGGQDKGSKGMEPGTLFRENVRIEFKLNGSGSGAVFNKCLEVKQLVTKMDRTGQPFKLISKDGRSSIAGAKDFPEWEAQFNEFFEVTAKSHRVNSSAFVGTRMESRMQMAKIKGVQQFFLWLRQKQIFLRPTKLESVQTSRIGFWKGLSPMDHSIGESKKRIKQSVEHLMASTEMETEGQQEAALPSFELVSATVAWVGLAEFTPEFCM
jgi:hypothetical protein